MLPELKRILVTTDFSQHAWLALRYAAALCELSKGKISIMHVMPELPKELDYTGGASLVYGYGPGYAGVPPIPPRMDSNDSKQREQRAREGRDKAEKMAKDHIQTMVLKFKSQEGTKLDWDKEPIVRIGNPVTSILDVVNSEGYDVLVMGRRGHGKLRGPRIGGVARTVLERSPVPVLLVKKK